MMLCWAYCIELRENRIVRGRSQLEKNALDWGCNAVNRKTTEEETMAQTRKRWLGAIANTLLLGMLPTAAIAEELRLTGLSIFSDNGAGGFSGQAQWDTVVGNKFWDLWVAPGGLEGDFLTLQPDFDYQLSPGQHTFGLFADALPSFNAISRFGLNLFFDHNPQSPGISAVTERIYGATAPRRTFFPAASNISNLESQTVLGAGTVVYQPDNFEVTLTDFEWFSPEAEERDRVFAYGIQPNGQPDMFGFFTLNVVSTAVADADTTDVPEPGVILAMLGVGGLLGSLKRRKL
ncbi:MAG: PEP-CTERM sorting domain-containing protein [Spirulina sp. SIO3F2]|nr:PEP-CTERM sorting domain-containing protein [Spirulina sp. SIO3F2]